MVCFYRFTFPSHLIFGSILLPVLLVEENFGSSYCTIFLLWAFAELLEQISLGFGSTLDRDDLVSVLVTAPPYRVLRFLSATLLSLSPLAPSFGLFHSLVFMTVRACLDGRPCWGVPQLNVLAFFR